MDQKFKENQSHPSAEVTHHAQYVDQHVPAPAYPTYPAGQASPTYVVQAAPSIPVGPNPVQTVCPSCRATIVSTIKHNPSTKTHLIAVLLCCICLPFMCVPYCVDSCQNADHYCPNCNSYLGTYANK